MYNISYNTTIEQAKEWKSTSYECAKIALSTLRCISLVKTNSLMEFMSFAVILTFGTWSTQGRSRRE